MKFKIRTLVDITCTQARKGADPIEYRKQQNYMTFVQTLSLRTNFVNLVLYVDEDVNINKLNFGTEYKGKHRVWTGTFETERVDDVLTVEQLNEDFDIVPIIIGLNETVNLEFPSFRSQNDAYRNIYFELDDK
jgi:hypothetical protein